MKAFILGDLHYGVHPLSLDRYLNITEQFFDDVFIPYVKEHYDEGDVIIQLGDVFDPRTSLNIKAMNYAANRFKELCELAPVHVLVGNHDMYQERSRTINSLITLKAHTPDDRLTIYSEPTKVKFGDRKCVMLPFIKSPNDQKVILDYATSKGKVYALFAHTDLYGCRYGSSLSDTSDKGLKIEDYAGFNRVISGHIHIRQSMGNFLYTGTPYHLTRKDIGNDKGFYTLEFETDELTFIKNEVSPEFVRIKIDSKEDLYKIEKSIERDDMVDIEIDLEFVNDQPEIKESVRRLSERGSVQKIDYIDQEAKEFTFVKDESSTELLPANWDIKPLSKAYIESASYDDKLKQRMEEVLDGVFEMLEV